MLNDGQKSIYSIKLDKLKEEHVARGFAEILEENSIERKRERDSQCTFLEI